MSTEKDDHVNCSRGHRGEGHVEVDLSDLPLDERQRQQPSGTLVAMTGTWLMSQEAIQRKVFHSDEIKWIFVQWIEPPPKKKQNKKHPPKKKQKNPQRTEEHYYACFSIQSRTRHVFLRKVVSFFVKHKIQTNLKQNKQKTKQNKKPKEIKKNKLKNQTENETKDKQNIN